MAVRARGGDVSLAQVEEELRAAEAYLHQYDPPGAPTASDIDSIERGAADGMPSSLPKEASDGWQQRSDGTTAHIHAPIDNDNFFRRRQKARPLLSEDRRKEILAKLSFERQAAMQVRKPSGSPVLNADVTLPETSPVTSQSSHKSPEERTQLLQKLFQAREERSTRIDETTASIADADHPDAPTSVSPFGSPRSDVSGDNSESHSQAFFDDNGDDDGELFYASDIIGNGLTAEIQPRSRMDLLYEYEEYDDHDIHSAGNDEGNAMNAFASHEHEERYEAGAQADSGAESTEEQYKPSLSPASLLAKVLSRGDEKYSSTSGQYAQAPPRRRKVPQDDIVFPAQTSRRPDFAAQPVSRKTVPQSEQEQAECSPVKSWTPNKDYFALHHHDHMGDAEQLPTDNEPFRANARRATIGAATISKRIEYLAQPRLDKFTEREKQRLLREMQSFQECTFRPDTTKSQLKLGEKKDSPLQHDTGREKEKDLPNRSNSAAFPWLMLSPRRQPAPDEAKGRVKWRDLEKPREQTVVQRLHLDGTFRYEQRERAKAELEELKLRECTFKPRVNNASRSMLNIDRYKPIHQRLSEIQRAKAESIKRIQEKIELEEDGVAPFVPAINPISREIVAKLHMERELEEQEDYNFSNIEDPDECRPLKPPKVVERLVSDAEKQLEKRIAIQEYYDAVQQQSFAPKISENSNTIVQQKPEFKMDFVSRQLHFQMQEREKMEALEDFCERAQNDGERITFKPDIGNANEVLRELRPDRFSESKSQKLYRMIYNDPKKTELKKQQLREEQYSKYTFKPVINPISKALGRQSTLDELAQPVSNLGPGPLDHSSPSPSPQRTSAKASSQASRVALQQYFAGKRFRSRVALEMDQAEKAECTFQPALIAKPRAKGISSSTSKLYTKQRQGKSIWRSDNILHLIETDCSKKAEALEAKRNELELQELRECTFQPNIRKHRDSQQRSSNTSGAGRTAAAPSSSNWDAPVIVRGLGRFLEMKEQAKRLRTEQKQREEKAFRPNAAYEPRSYTVPKPFNLSESSKDAIRRRLKVREEMRAKEKQECTFAPVTIESKHRKVLQNLLRD